MEQTLPVVFCGAMAPLPALVAIFLAAIAVGMALGALAWRTWAQAQEASHVNETISRLESKIEGYKDALTENKDGMRRLRAELAAERDDKQRTADNAVQLAAQVAALQAEVDDSRMKERHAEVALRQEKVATAVATAKAEFERRMKESVKQELAQADVKLVGLRHKLRVERARSADAEDKAARTWQQVVDLMMEAELTNAAISRLTMQKVDLKAEVEDLRQRVATRTERVEALEKSLVTEERKNEGVKRCHSRCLTVGIHRRGCDETAPRPSRNIGDAPVKLLLLVVIAFLLVPGCGPAAAAQ